MRSFAKSLSRMVCSMMVRIANMTSRSCSVSQSSGKPSSATSNCSARYGIKLSPWSDVRYTKN